MNADSESLPMTDAGMKFQTDGDAHRKKTIMNNTAIKNQNARGSPLIINGANLKAKTQKLLQLNHDTHPTKSPR